MCVWGGGLISDWRKKVFTITLNGFLSISSEAGALSPYPSSDTQHGMAEDRAGLGDGIHPCGWLHCKLGCFTFHVTEFI